ncbi:MAG TPA: chloride channel protein [Candidatus Krumholzibacteriaceae bacterium]|nr:chloride channel protein [Candidatus Krumholzibacteriaceae bacterium]
MSKLEDKPEYYLLVAIVGIVGAVSTIAFYVLYLNIWNETLTILSYSSLYVFLFAFLALAISFVLVRFFAESKSTGSGTHTVLETYHLKNGETSLRDTIIKPLASVFTMGFGGSAGPEGPSLLVGGGLASNIAKRFKVRINYLRRIFIAGAAAGLAAVFRTPLTGILFALEIPYKRDLDMETFVEASIATIPSYLISVVILGSERFFGSVSGGEMTLSDIGLSLVLGLICGLYAIFFTKIFSLAGNVRIGLRKRIGSFGLIAVGAVSLGAIGYFSLHAVGVGLDFVNELVKGTGFTVAFVLAIVLLKTFATTITLNFGGSGGLFFPTIVIGAGIGYAFSILSGNGSSILFVAVGMAALLSGTHKILLTPTAFVVETLGGVYAIPALIASGVSYLISRGSTFYTVQPKTRLKTEELAVERFFFKAKKNIPTKLENTVAKDFMTTKPVYIHIGTTIKDALGTFEKTRLRVLPVVDEKMKVVGAVTMEDLGNVDSKHMGETLSEMLTHRPLVIRKEDSLEKIAELMMEKGEDHVFVADENETLIGVISGIDIVRKIVELSA